MSDAVNLTVFGTKLRQCLKLHRMTVPQLAERTAIEEQRINALLDDSRNLGYYELVCIADAFRIEPSIFVLPDAKFPVEIYCGACKQFDPNEGLLSNTGRIIEPDADNLIKINETLLACQFLQELWERNGQFKNELLLSVDISNLGDDPGKAGKEAARRFREKMHKKIEFPRHDVITPHIRQYARQAGVHVFRQKIAGDTAKFYAICLFGRIGTNDNGRIAVYGSGQSYYDEQFCIAHELGHALFGKLEAFPLIPSHDLQKPQIVPDSDEEKKADAFASELLLPSEYVRANAGHMHDLDAVIVFSKKASCCVEIAAYKLWEEELIDDELHDEAVEWSKNNPRQHEPYSLELQQLFERLHQKPEYTHADIERFKDLIDRGLSDHFVCMCKDAFGDNNKDRNEIVARCAEVFAVPETRIEKAFKMYESIERRADHPQGS